MTMTPKQTELWKVADKKIRELGGPRIFRHPNTKIEGTVEWALSQADGYACGVMADDETCQKLINAIQQ